MNVYLPIKRAESKGAFLCLPGLWSSPTIEAHISAWLVAPRQGLTQLLLIAGDSNDNSMLPQQRLLVRT